MNQPFKDLPPEEVAIDSHGEVRCPGCKDYTFCSIPGPRNCPSCGQKFWVVEPPIQEPPVCRGQELWVE